MGTETTAQTVARLYRDMTPAQIAAHEDWVRRFTASKEGKAAAADREARKAVVSLAALMECSKRELAVRVTELTAELDRERARSAQARRDSETATHMARTMNTGVPAVGSFG